MTEAPRKPTLEELAMNGELSGEDYIAITEKLVAEEDINGLQSDKARRSEIVRQNNLRRYAKQRGETHGTPAQSSAVADPRRSDGGGSSA